MSKQLIRVKFLTTVSKETWLHQLPNADPIFKNCEFIFDPEDNNYDWVVVYDDLMPGKGERFSTAFEKLVCHPKNSILFTQEPSSIKIYGYGYTSQFGHVVTSQPFFALPHSNRIYSQASLFWFYGVGREKTLAFEQLCNGPSLDYKTDNISVVWSNKKQLHTVHHQRIIFLQKLREALPELKVYGRGEKSLGDKAEALDTFKYHIAIENHIGKHHWTEKLADSYLGLTLPFYFGCPNINDYFPESSYIAIDIFKPYESIAIIKKAILNKEFEKRKESIFKAREQLISNYNIFVIINEIIESSGTKKQSDQSSVLFSRRAANRKNIFNFSSYITHKTITRIYYFMKNFVLKLLSSNYG